MTTSWRLAFSLVLAGSGLALQLGCSGGGDAGSGGGGMGAGGGATPGDVYEFPSRFDAGRSAVSHTGQTLRHVLIEDLERYVGALTEAVDGGGTPPQTQAEVVAALQFFYDFDGATGGAELHGVTTTPAPLQAVYDDISSGKSLREKMAGNDGSTDHADWDGGAFVGWRAPDIAAHGGSLDSPEGLLLAMFNTLGRYVEQRLQAGPAMEPGTTMPIPQVHVTTTGIDLQQLIQKFLLMGVAYSQGADDYLDDDVDGKGLSSPNTQEEGEPYTLLGHHFDEGFGYFGAARDYLAYSDEEIAAEGGRSDWQGHHDSDGDGAIDLAREHNWGASVNAAKRDLGAGGSTDFTTQAMRSFIDGRALILAAGESLTADELSTLRVHAETAVAAWENAIVATVVHYINDTIADTEAIDADPAAYVFVDHAKHWSEMKGFALGLQFNPRSKIAGADFAELHGLMGDQPVLATATPMERAAYVTSLQMARDLIGQRYGFTAAQLEGW